MKIKKMSVKAPAGAGSPVAGGAAIADRFKLDPIDNGRKRGAAGTTSRKSATVALVFGVIALVISVALTFTIWKHWEYLMPA